MLPLSEFDLNQGLAAAAAANYVHNDATPLLTVKTPMIVFRRAVSMHGERAQAHQC